MVQGGQRFELDGEEGQGQLGALFSIDLWDGMVMKKIVCKTDGSCSFCLTLLSFLFLFSQLAVVDSNRIGMFLAVNFVYAGWSSFLSESRGGRCGEVVWM